MTLVPVDTTSALAVSDYLTRARDWLATAVEKTGPAEIAAAKAEIATAAEATKQLGLSQEIQQDAEEMVRRAQYALRKSQLKEQSEGRMRSRSTNLKNQPERSAETSTSINDLPTPRDFFASEVEYRDSSAMGALDSAAFDEVIDEARGQGNLSRANVARLAREKSGEPTKPRRRPLHDVARDAGWDLRKSVERVERVFADDRFTTNAEQVTPHLRSHLIHAIEACQGLLDRIDNN